MAGATFVEATGLDPQNMATAHGVALLVRKALNSEEIKRVVAKRSYDFTAPNGDRRHVDSTDQLLDSFLSRPPYAFLGGKTGYLDEAGYCFGAAAENPDGDRVVAVVLGADNKDDRFREVKRLIYWTFDVYEWPTRARN
jgi:D-alanyl-D-alanine carboxypeptidase (penicillin-binding protein 5/6)